MDTNYRKDYKNEGTVELDKNRRHTPPSNPDSNGKLQLQEEVEQVKGVIIQNMGSILEGERIQTIVDKSDKLVESAKDFNKDAIKLKRRIQWRNRIIVGSMISTGLIFLIIFASIIYYEVTKFH